MLLLSHHPAAVHATRSLCAIYCLCWSSLFLRSVQHAIVWLVAPQLVPKNGAVNLMLFGTSSTIVWFGYAMVCWLDEAWQSALWSSNLFFGYLLIKGLYRQQSCLAGLVATALGFILSVLGSCKPWSWTVSSTKYPCTCKLHCYLMVTPAGEAHALEH